MRRRYSQGYRAELEQDPLLKKWLCQSRENNNNAHCKACNCDILSRVASLKENMGSAKHIRNMRGFSGRLQVFT